MLRLDESKEEIPFLPQDEDVPCDNNMSSSQKSCDFRTMAMKRMNSSSIYFKDDDHGWLPGELIEQDEESGEATVIYTEPNAETKEQEVRIKLNHYGPSKSLPLRCLDHEGSSVVVQDLRDLPYSNEASILYNLKERYQKQKMPYTRATNNVLIAINPYHWNDGLYSKDLRREYAEQIVWKGLVKLPPHLYEISSEALKGILSDGADQTIVVSGESGSGKTTSSKILMRHLATFQGQRVSNIVQKAASQQDNPIPEKNEVESTEGDNKRKWLQNLKNSLCSGSVQSVISESDNVKLLSTIEPLKKETPTKEMYMKYSQQFETVIDTKPTAEVNPIVQRVIDSNPLLEAFGNAKTFLNDNSSRFSRYSKLQFHVEDGVLNPVANIAGSVCHTFLLEKSRIVSHESSNDERTFHIFYQLLAASAVDKSMIWEGLVGKSAESFKYIGVDGGNDEYVNSHAWKKTISALTTIGVVGEELQMLLSTICIVLQIGNIVFCPNPLNEEAAVIENKDELKVLAEMLGIETEDLSYCLTHKTMKTYRDTFQVPLKMEDAKSTCDAFAKECYRALFDWLVSKINESTCADSNYSNADRVDKYNCISVLDICGFECFETNGYEQLLINHTNERLQKTFTETIIDSVIEEYESEGLPIEKLEHEDNKEVIRFLEGRVGLMSLLNEECILPRGSDAGFVRKVYATHKSDIPSSKLFFKRNFQLAEHSKCMFGIKHFAKDVTYDATGFLMKNKDTLPYEVVRHAITSTNEIIRDGLSLHESSTPKKKSALTGTSLWSSFERQMTNLFVQIKQTRMHFVRCIIPNNEKKPFSLDLKHALNQLRHVGLLTALKISHSSFPNKQTFTYILQRFWVLGDSGKEYKFGLEDNVSVLRDDCEKLLKGVFKSKGFSNSFVMGFTKVYFRSGSLETLESERTKTYDKSATQIQARVRGILSRKQYSNLIQEKAVVVDQTCGVCIIQ